MTVVVGKTFHDLVLGTPVHAMVEFYAPWCGACKQFAPSWEKIGEQTKQHYGGAIRVVKIDATENEVKGFDMPQAFPLSQRSSGSESTNGEKTSVMYLVSSHNPAMFCLSLQGVCYLQAPEP